MKLIAPSLLSCDFGRLAEEVIAVQEAGADILHVDVMDGHFVPNITIGPLVVEAIRKHAKVPVDCHLMIEDPARYVERFAEAGADMISIHVETRSPEKVLQQLKKMKVKAGIVINPPTDVNKIYSYIDYADFALVMTVNPGFGGQSIIPEAIFKIAEIKNYMKSKGYKKPIEVDGGIKAGNVKKVVDAGADIIVAGSAVFGEKDYAKAIRELREMANS